MAESVLADSVLAESAFEDERAFEEVSTVAGSGVDRNAVAPAAGASKAALRCRLDRRVGTGAAWEFSKGKKLFSRSCVKRGGANSSSAFGWRK